MTGVKFKESVSSRSAIRDLLSNVVDILEPQYLKFITHEYRNPTTVSTCM